MSVEQLIYTDAARGQGVDPSHKGFQIKACSPGLAGQMRSHLEDICKHYFSTVYGAAPAASKALEQSWRGSTANADVMPDEILQSFPVIVSYDRLGDGCYALSNSRYIGFTHDKRPGNALVHATVFGIRELAPFLGNPLGASRSRIFLTRDTTQGTTLPALADFGQPLGHPNGTQAPTEPRIEPSKLEALIAAIAAAPLSGRPVLLCLHDWRQAAPLIEWLLGLLPPSARLETTFTTLESDRRWVPPMAGGARQTGKNGRVAGHDVLVICRIDERPIDLRPDELRSFAVFNFVDDRWSDVTSTPYAAFAAQAATSGGLARLQSFHELVERLGLGGDRAAWDALVPAATLLPGTSLRGLPLDPVRALAGVARSAGQAGVVLDLIWPPFQALVAAADLEKIETLREIVVRLVELEPATGPAAHRDALIASAGQSLGAGRARLAALLLRLCGKERERGLVTVLRGWLAQATQAQRPGEIAADERAALCDLLIAGTRAAVASGDPVLAPTVLAVPILEAVAGAGGLATAWSEIGEILVREPIGAIEDDAKLGMAERLRLILTPATCPEGSLWLSLQLIRSRKLDDKRLEGILVQAANSLARAPGSESTAAELIEAAKTAAGDRLDRRAQLYGLLASAALKSPLGHLFRDAYTKTIEEVCEQNKGGGDRGVRRWLIDQKATALIANDCLRAVLDTSADPSFTDATEAVRFAMKEGAWWPLIKPAVIDDLRRAVADRLDDQKGDQKRSLAFAQILLSKDNGPLETGAAASLVTAVVCALPLGPLDKEWNATLEACPQPKDSAERGRFEALRALTFVDKRASDGKGSGTVAALAQCTQEMGQTWQALTNLPPDDLRGVVGFCVKRLVSAGVTTAADAEALIGLVASVRLDPASDLADIVEGLLEGRDEVTRVLVMTCFAVSGMQKRDRASDDLLAALLKRSGRQVRGLFQDHLHKRFFAGEREYRTRMISLCERLGLDSPTRETPAATGVQIAAMDGGRGQQEPSPAGGGWRKFKGLLGLGTTKDGDSKGG